MLTDVSCEAVDSVFRIYAIFMTHTLCALNMLVSRLTNIFDKVTFQVEWDRVYAA